MSLHAGKTVLVTGAARGIGAALCERLSADGARVIGVDRDAGAAHTQLAVDLADPQSIAALESALPSRIDALACVAGVPGTLDPATVIAVNFIGTRDFTRLCLPRMAQQGSLVFVSSVTAHRCNWGDTALEGLAEATPEAAPALLGDCDGVASYEISKRVLNHWVLSRLPAFAGRGLRANLVSPGPVRTALLPEFEASIGKARIDAAAEISGRHGEPAEIAAAIAFLLGSDASWVNGVELKVDGGYHALRAARDRVAESS